VALPPRVSVLLPARNAAATLAPCLRSLRRQTFPDWECLLVDDGSADSTRTIALETSARDPRFHVLSIPHSGLIAALNTGLRRCRGQYVARMDADDVMHRDRLAAQIRMLETDRDLAGVGCHVRIFPRAAMSPRRREYETWLNGLRSADDVARDAFVECPVAHPSLMMRREMAALGYRDCGWPEDYDLILRALRAGLRVGIVPRRLLGWRDGRDRLSRTDPRYALRRFVACKAHHLASAFLHAREEYILWGYGGTGRVLRRALAELGKTPSHIVEVKPSRLGRLIHGAPVIPPEALPELRGARVVVSVARVGPRTEIRRALSAMGFLEGTDYVCAA
jgi:glycosyltransferase involved in cell wall biosynthesis